MTTNRAAPIAYFLLRLVAGLLFFQAGSMKFLGWFGGMPGGPPGGTAPLMTQIGIGGLLEFFGGIAIMLGLFTRPVAFILSGEMAVAYWQFLAPQGAWPIQNHGDSAVLFCFIFLFMAAQGGGPFSLDALIDRLRSKAPGRRAP
ncbi:MAG: DoxX family protein [Acidobacteria bacterium]|nr:DoxX family protein [Acidobacteriota bacterium]